MNGNRKRRTSGRRAVLLLWVALVASAPAASAVTRHVPASYPVIQDAIDGSVARDTVLVAPGVYTGPRNRSLDFHGRDLVLLSETGPQSTTIDCENSGGAVYLHTSETGAAVIDGFTIRNAQSSMGAVCLVECSPTVRNCVITENASYGVRCYGGWPKIVGCEITRNWCGVSIDRNVTIRDCLIADNSDLEGMSGGGILNHGLNATIENCTIVRNHATYGGGIACRGYNSETTVNNCLIADNTATQGGALYRDTGSNGCTLWRCTIRNNTAAGEGGAIYARPYHLSLVDCAVIGNSATDGGAIYAESVAGMAGCLFSGNLASSRGGAVFATEYGPDVEGCTFAGNRALDLGGAIYMQGDGEFRTSIFHGDCAQGAGTGDEIYADGSFLMFHCCQMLPEEIDGARSVDWLEGHVATDPLFCGPVSCLDAPTTGGDYSLSVAGACLSPCLERYSPCETRIGARGAGTCGCSAIRTTSWGKLRSLFRN